MEKATNLSQALLNAMDTYSDRICFQVKRHRHYEEISYRDFQTLSFRLTRFFRLQSVARIAIIADNCLEWIIAYIAGLLAGGMVVPMRTSLAPATLRSILRDSRADLVVLNNIEQGRAILGNLNLESKEHAPELKHILVIKAGEAPPPSVTVLDRLLRESSFDTDEAYGSIEAVIRGIAPGDPVSGFHIPNEGGGTQGATFNHAQGIAAMRHIAEWLSFDRDDVAFTLTPWSELPNLLVSLRYFLSGVPNALLDSHENAEENLRETSPTLMLATPSFFERTYDRIMDEIAQMPESSQNVFRWAVEKGKEYRTAESTASAELRQAYTRADLTFFSQTRGRFGGRLQRLYSTSASLSQEVAEFFEALGLPALNLYSLMEAGGFPAVSRPGARRPGSCGKVAPGYELRIAEDGEVLVRGETVMRPYWGPPQAQRHALQADGWLHSGDVGYFDRDGFLYITGRKQHLMVLSTGHKFAPAIIEEALCASPYIAQAAVFGEGRPYVSALIVPESDAITASVQPENEETLGRVGISHPDVKALLDIAITAINQHLDLWEQVKEYRVLATEPPGMAGETATLTSTNLRRFITDHHPEKIAEMYPASIQLGEEKVTQVQIDPERLRELLEKEGILDAWMGDVGIGFLFQLARAKQIDAPSMVHISEAAVTIAQMESEEKPLSTALIVGDPVRIARILPPSQIQLLRHDHIRRMRKILVTMAKIVDGLVLGYVVDKYGYVRGVHKLAVKLDEPGSLLLGPQFRHHAAISRECDAVVFFVPAGGRQVRVFAEGQLVGSYANGDWSPDDMIQAEQVVAQLAADKVFALDLVLRVLRVAFRMSEENLGAIFLLGNTDAILERSDASEISSFATFLTADVGQLSDRELINFAKQDGATMIDVQARFQGCMVLLRPRARTIADIGPGKGARHSSAAKMSAEAQCLAITVSQDGPVTVYDCGKQVLSL